MTDRELLELAAKAAGLKHVDYSGIDYDGRLGIVLVDEIGRHCSDWNPLADDGDALRLAMAMRITVEQSLLETMASAYVLVGLKKEHFVSISGKVSREEATRRAIVRTAAEIGKAMQ